MARNVRAIVISAFAVAVVVLLFFASRMDGAMAADTACPTNFLVETTNDHDYVAVFTAPMPASTGVDMTFYTRNGAYELARSSFAIATPFRIGATSFRSGPLLAMNPSNVPFLAVAIRFVPDGRPTSCTPVHVMLLSAEEQKKRRLDKADLELRQAVAKEANAARSEIIPENVSGTIPALQCTTPFSDATMTRAVEPDYPIVARLAGATGMAQIKITLDSAGRVTAATVYKSSGNAALDNATLTAARRSTYRAGQFLCEPDGNSYIFEADFSGH